MCNKFNVIGISDSRRQHFNPEILDIIKKSKVFSGGKRHHEIMSEFLPAYHIWIDVALPLSEVFDVYEKYDEITVFASGDPLFFGYAATLQREFPESEINIYPSFNSTQMLAHRIGLPYQDMINISLTGRPWKNLDDALIHGYHIIGCLTDRNKGPAEIAQHMLDYGYSNYTINVGTSLGNDTKERIETLTLTEASKRTFGNPNCIILQMKSQRFKYFGIPENEFFHLKGRDNMITKMPVRLLSLSMLDLHNRTSFWDIGFCTGSVSIEARLQFPHLDITAFEIRDESRELMIKNSEKFGTPSITSVIGDFIKVDLSKYPRPDAVFIGGHRGRLKEILKRLKGIMLSECIIVFNSVRHESCELFRESIKSIGMTITDEHCLALDSFNPITILKAQ